MAEISVLIIEDDDSYALEVEMIILELGYQVQAVVNNSEEALALVKKQRPDLILIDIFIDGEKDGIQVAEAIQPLDIPIIFITAHNQPTLYQRSRDLSPFAFIIKPFDKYTLQSMVESAIQLLGSNSPQQRVQNHFYIKHNNQLDKVYIDRIHWIEVEGNYCILHTVQRRYAVKMSLRKLKEKLPDADFLQIHRGQIVQLAKIKNLDLQASTVILEGATLPLGPKYKNDLLNRLNLL
ncbi:MAG: response regulator transcription factor [Bacteroidota bacterium]